MKNTFILCAFLALSSFTVAQQSEKYPLGDYTELTDTKPHDSDEIWDKLSAPTQLSWGTTDIRYPKLSIPDVKKSNRWQTKAWKGERVNAQAGVMDQGGTRGCLYHRERLKERFFHHPILRDHDELCPIRHDR